MVRQVCVLWHQLSEPLKTRARFWAGFRGREDYFWATELRRLTHAAERVRLQPSTSHSPRSTSVALAARRQLARTERALQVRLLLSGAMQGLYRPPYHCRHL